MTKNKIKIAYIIPTLSLGGAEKQQIAIFNSIDRNIFDPQLFVLKNSLELLPQIKNINEVKIYNSKGFLSLLFSGIIKDLKGFQPDIIHSQMYNANLFSRLISIFIPKAKIINHIHGFSKWMRVHNIIFERITSFLTDSFIVTGKTSKDLRLSRERYTESKITIIPSSAEIEKFRSVVSIKNDTINVGVISRLIKLKRIDKVINFIKYCIDKKILIHLHIAGDGTEKKNLESLVDERKIKDNVTFHGFVENTEKFYKIIDCFFITSDTEDFPLSVVEALASGLPIVSTPVGNIPDILEETCSLLTNLEECDYDNVLNFITDIDYNDCNKNRIKSEKYSHENYMKKLTDLYLNL
jgi:L-malate glycosyltransferase